ncbi:MAG: hypothetical protein ACI83D_000444 [Planctomycetota bacterium]|jgi:hypothetical protein
MHVFLLFIISILALTTLLARKSWTRYARSEHINSDLLPYFENWFTIDFVAIKDHLRDSVGVMIRRTLSRGAYGIVWILRSVGRRIVRWLDKTAYRLKDPILPENHNH